METYIIKRQFLPEGINIEFVKANSPEEALSIAVQKEYNVLKNKTARVVNTEVTKLSLTKSEKPIYLTDGKFVISGDIKELWSALFTPFNDKFLEFEGHDAYMHLCVDATFSEVHLAMVMNKLEKMFGVAMPEFTSVWSSLTERQASLINLEK